MTTPTLALLAALPHLAAASDNGSLRKDGRHDRLDKEFSPRPPQRSVRPMTDTVQQLHELPDLTERKQS